MSVSYMVDLERLDESIGDMARFDELVQKHLDALDKVVAQLHGEWHGAAAVAQQDAHAKWAQGAAEMRKALAQMRAAAHLAHTNYTNAAQTNRRMWSQVR